MPAWMLLDGWDSHARGDVRDKCREMVHDIKSVVLACHDKLSIG